MPFLAASFPGYESKRNTTGRSFKNLHTQRMAYNSMRSWTYHLGLQQSKQSFSLPKSSAGETVASLSCEVCGKSFSCAQGLKTHSRQVHELKKYGDWKSADRSVTCGTCGRAFGDEDALRQHELAAHTKKSSTSRGRWGVEGYSYRSCEICGMSLPLGMSMSSHLEALKPSVDLPYLCVCGRSFVEERAMEQHQRFCKEHQRQGGTRLQGAVAFLGRFSQTCCGAWASKQS